MARRTAVRDPWVWGQVILATVVIFAVPACARRWGVLDPAGVTRWLGWTMIGLGLVVLYGGIAVLGRNLTPATEPLPEGQLVTRGLYRLVRHPIYLGYLVTHAGFLLSNMSARNVAIYGAAYVFQVARIYAEERILSEDGRYREYLRCVRYRLIPGIF
jgi:protein-S-isoprenylcysteine O-methyltransferase Ste14